MKWLLKIKKLSIWNKKGVLLKNSFLNISEGEIVGLFGKSGSGKSVFSKFLLGLLNLSFFRVSVKEMIFKNPNSVLNLKNFTEEDWCNFRSRWVSMVFQDPTSSLNPTIRCGKQLAEVVKTKYKKTKCLELLTEVGFDDPEKVFFSYPHELSGGQKQRVVIAIALASNPLLLIADEPTTALDPFSQREILKLLLSLKKSRNLSILFISHNWEMVNFFCERVIIYRNNTFIEKKSPYVRGYVKEKEDIIQKIKSKNYNKIHDIENLYHYSVDSTDLKSVIFQIDDMSVSYSSFKKKFFALKNIFLKLNTSETLGVIGGSGSGKTTLGRVIAGLEKEYTGTYSFYGDSLKKDVQIVYQDPFSSFNPLFTVEDTINEIIDLYENDNCCKLLLSFVGLNEKYLNKYPHQLSGGEQQRVAIARVLASCPKVIIFDESLSGLDLEIQFSLLRILKSINLFFNITIVFISHDINTVYYLCDKIVVLKNGEMVDQLVSEDLFTKNVSKYTDKLVKKSVFK